MVVWIYATRHIVTRSTKNMGNGRSALAEVIAKTLTPVVFSITQKRHVLLMRKHIYRVLALFSKQSWRDNAFVFAVQTADPTLASKIAPFVSRECKTESFKTVAQMCLTLDRLKNGQTQEFSDRPLKDFWRGHWAHDAVGKLLKNNTVDHLHTQMFATLDMCIAHNVVNQSCLLDFPFIEEKSNLPLAYHTFNTHAKNQIDAARALENEGLSIVAHHVFTRITLDEETIWDLMRLMADNLSLSTGRSVGPGLISPNRHQILPKRDVQYIWKHFYTQVNWTRCPFDVLSHLIMELPSAWLQQLLTVHPATLRFREFYNILKCRSETSIDVFEEIKKCGGDLKPSTFSKKSAFGGYLPPQSQNFEKDYEQYTEHANNKAQNQRLNDAVAPSLVGRARKL